MQTPRYLKLADTLAKSIESGKLPPGSRLPTHRAFAETFGVALATATRVYGELERRGLVVGEAGRGTFVRDPDLPITLGVHQTSHDGMVDLVFNMPGDAEDADTLRAGLRALAGAGDLEAMLRYQPHGGRPHERRIIAESLAPTLGTVSPESLLVTSGSQHGLAIIGLGVLQRGDAVAVDALTYPGFKSAAALHGLDLVPVRSEGGVMDPEDLDRQCSQRAIRAAYLMPTVHNPTGTVMEAPTRHRVVQVARAHGLLIIEDAAYAFLEPSPPPSFLALAPELTLHVGGFSKSFATGLRLGYVVAPDDHHAALLEAIRATTWNAPALISCLVTGWIEDGTLEASMQRRRRDGAARQAICRAALVGLNISSHPNGGFAWVWLDTGLRAEPIVARLRAKNISVAGAEAFACTPAVPQALRLAFGGIDMATLPGILQTVAQEIATERALHAM